MRPDAVLLDLDGTLVDSAREMAVAVNEVRRAHGLADATLGEVRDWVGEGVGVLLGRALHEYRGSHPDEGTLARARSLFDAAYARVIGTASLPFPGVTEGLDRLRTAGIPMACLTNKPERFAHLLLEALDLHTPFDAIVGGDTADKRKPDPEPALLAADRLGVAIGGCLVIGDSAIDVATARNAGCPVWCLRSGYSRGQAPDDLGADALFDRFDELVDALLAQRGAPPT